MNSKRKFIPRRGDKTIKVVFESYDVYLELRLNPHRYFYPFFDYQYRTDYNEEDGYSVEDFEKSKRLSIKLDKMFRTKKFKKLFEKSFTHNLENFLMQIEGETEIHYEDGESLDYKVSKNEALIFELLEMKGPGVLRYNAVIKKIHKWCIEKELKKIESIVPALKNYAKKTYCSTPFSYFQSKYFVAFEFPHLRKSLKSLKNDIRLHRNRFNRESLLEKFILDKWSDKDTKYGYQWFTRLQKCFKRQQEIIKKKGEAPPDFIPFIESMDPRELSLMIFAELINKSPSTIDKILRKKEEIIEIMSPPLEKGGHRNWWDLRLY